MSEPTEQVRETAEGTPVRIVPWEGAEFVRVAPHTGDWRPAVRNPAEAPS